MTASRRKGTAGKPAAKGGMLIRGAHVLSVHADVPEGRYDIRVADGAILELGERLRPAAGEEVVDARGLVAMPGLVQAHVHLCQTLFRGLADDMELLTWLRERIWPLEGALTEADMRSAARLGIAELLLGGTTTVLDMGSVRHTDALFLEAERLGLRYTGGKAIMDQGQGYPAALRETSAEAMAESVRLCDAWHNKANGRLRYAFSPRFALSCSEESLRACVREARARGALLHTHAAENPEEVQLVQERTGMGNVEYLHSLGFSGSDVVLAHGIWMSGEERRVLQETQTCIAHCPSSNLKLASGIARVVELVADGVPVALGADGAPCNNRLDGFTEMRTAALLHKPRSGPQALDAKTALHLGTRAGALALGLGKVGCIAPGFAADIILLDLYRPHTWPPLADLTSRVVYSARASDVHSVFVAGRALVREGALVNAKLDSILNAAQKAAQAVVRRAGL